MASERDKSDVPMSEADTSVLSDDTEPKKPLPSFDSETTESKDENSQNDSKNENPPSERSGSAEKETVKHLDASKVEYIGDKCYYTGKYVVFVNHITVYFIINSRNTMVNT